MSVVDLSRIAEKKKQAHEMHQGILSELRSPPACLHEHWLGRLVTLGHYGKVGEVSDFIKIMICFKIVTFKSFGRKIFKFKQIILNFGKIAPIWGDLCLKILAFQCFGRKIVKFKQIILHF